jgi:hypothetical protein
VDHEPVDCVVVSVRTGEPEIPAPLQTFTVTVLESPTAVLAAPDNAGVVSFVNEPLAGETSVTAGAAVSTVHDPCAGVGSTLPAGSTARTSKPCAPSDRPLYDLGDEQAAKPAPSSRHWKLALPSGELKLNDASFTATVPDGPESIVVFGAVVSMVKVLAELEPVLPASSDCSARAV